MSVKYTREDIIFWPDDTRLKDAIGKEVYHGIGGTIYELVNRGKLKARKLIEIHPEYVDKFWVKDERGYVWHAYQIIIKKENEDDIKMQSLG